MSIALGIGANTAIFTLVDEVLLRMLPVKHPEQLVLFNGARNHYGSNSGGNMLSYLMYEDFRDNFVDRDKPFDFAQEKPFDSPQDRPFGSAQGKPARISQPLPNPAPTPKIFSGMFARRPIAMNVGSTTTTSRSSACRRQDSRVSTSARRQASASR